MIKIIPMVSMSMIIMITIRAMIITMMIMLTFIMTTIIERIPMIIYSNNHTINETVNTVKNPYYDNHT